MEKICIWFGLAFDASTFKRSLKVALIVGTLLMIINHGDAIFVGAIGYEQIIKIFLSYLVPFLVSTYSSVASKLNS